MPPLSNTDQAWATRARDHQATLTKPHGSLGELDMRLGEGSGAALAIPLLRAAAAIQCDMASFADAGVSERGDPQG